MPRFFTHYWKNQTFREQEKRSDGPSGLLDHTASNEFRKRGVSVGDVIYICSVIKGRLFLVGSIEVAAILSQKQARTYLKTDDVWEAKDHIVCGPDRAMPMRFDVEVPLPLTEQLRFTTGAGEDGLIFAEPGKLDTQTLRGIRELTAASAKLLDQVLGSIVSLPSDVNKVLEQAFDPASANDSRVWDRASILLRRGQPQFRMKLLDAYDRRCAVTGCDVEQALEAAHIYPYHGEETNHVSNGLLLRADIHTLFDVGLLSVDSSSMKVILAPTLTNSTYAELAECSLRLPTNSNHRPSPKALEEHRKQHNL